MKKKLLLIITLMLITASAFVITSYAADDVAEPIVSGEWGDLHWTLNENTGELIISGSGDMEDYSNVTTSNWHQYSSLIKTVEIQHGITSIGSSAFMGCSNLTSITIPKCVTTIGTYAFGHCESLKSIMIPPSVTYIGWSAFYGTYLENVYISDVEAWLNISFGDLYDSHPNRYGTLHILDSDGNDVSEFVIPNTVTEIRAYAFTNSILTSIEIPDSVTEIGSSAFSGCSSLTSITIPDSVTEIGGSAFEGCSSLTNITIPDSVTSIGSSAFFWCTKLTSIKISSNLTKISSHLFRGCSSLTSITIPNNVTDIGELAFYDCNSLTSITIPNSVISIGNSAFEGCKSLKDVYIADLEAWLNISMDDDSYLNAYGTLHILDSDGKDIIEIVLPDTVTEIRSCAFKNCALTSITIPNSVTDIGNSAFSKCSNLTDIIIPDSVIGIGSMAFYGCNSLTSINIPDGVTEIYGWTFSGCSSLTNIFIPDSVTTLGDYAFSECSNLRSIKIGRSVSNIGYCTFSECTAIEDIYVTNIESWLNITFGYYSSYPQSRGTLHFLDKNGDDITSFIIPNGITEIKNYAFCNSTITSITIPSSVVSIGTSAFYGCNNLTSVYITDIETWLSIDFESPILNFGGKLYLNNELVTSLTIPDGFTNIGKYTFYGCSSLTSITIPDSVTTIGSSAFQGCDSLTSVTLPKGLTSIDYSVFRECSNLINIYIPDGVSTIGENAFRDCGKLASITIPDSITNIGDKAFYGCNGLKDIYVANIEAWLNISYGYNAYEYNYLNYYGTLHFLDEDGNEITEIVIPDSVTEIGKNAFMNCVLTSIEIPNSVKNIGEYAFSNSNNLTSIYIPDSITTIGEKAFQDCISLTNVYITDIVAWLNIDFYNSASTPLSYGGNLYLNEELVTSLTVPEGITDIGAYTFYGCNSLTSITLPKGIIGIGIYAFQNSGLERIVIPNTIANISYYALDRITLECVQIIYCGTADEWNNVSKSNMIVGNGAGSNVYFCNLSYHEYKWTSDLKTHSGVCLLCGDIVDTTLHTFQDYGEVTKKPTHTTEGIRTYTCKDCGQTKDEAIEKLTEHDYGYWQPHDEEQHKMVCACGEAIYEEHSEWEYIGITKPATHLEEGIALYRCYDCWGDKEEPIPKTTEHSYSGNWIFHDEQQHKETCACGDAQYAEHDWVETGMSVIPTHLIEGVMNYWCYDCRGGKTKPIEKWAEHTYGDWMVTQQPTEKTPGVKEKACECGHKITEAVPVLEHDYQTTITDPTCTEQGHTTHTCANCGDVYVDTYVDALGHSYSNSQDTTCNKCYYTREITPKEPVNKVPPSQKQEESSDKNVGPIIGVTIGGLGVASFAVYWFVLRKKKKL